MNKTRKSNQSDHQIIKLEIAIFCLILNCLKYRIIQNNFYFEWIITWSGFALNKKMPPV